MPTQPAPRSFLFFTPYGGWPVHNQLDGLVAAAAKHRGHAIHFVTCDGLYEPCAITQGTRDCVSCRAAMESTLSLFGLQDRTLSALMQQRDIGLVDEWVSTLPAESYATAQYGDLAIGEWATSTVMSHFRVSQTAQLSDPRITPIHKRFLRDTLLTYLVMDRFLEAAGIDAVFLFNARYYPYRAVYEAARRRRIRILVHERGRIADSFSFFDDLPSISNEPVRRLCRAWADVPLDQNAIAELDRHFQQKLSGQAGHWPGFYSAVQATDPFTALDIPRNARLLGFFTTSSDELSGFDYFGPIMRQFDLIDQVVKVLSDTETYLIVRHHPAIGGKSAASVEISGFDRAYAQAAQRHPHVRIIMPSDQISSYALFPYLQGAIAPFSTVAMEMAALAEIAGPDVALIEDACHALGETDVGACRHAFAACFSTHAVKAIATAEGGVTTTADPQVAQKMRSSRSHGMVREKDHFLNDALALDGGEMNPWYYEMSDVGWNYREHPVRTALRGVG